MAKKLIVFGLMASLTVTTMSAQPKLRADNIDEVLKAMTLEEKAKLLVGGANNFFSEGAVVGGEADLVAGAAGNTAEIARLGIPATVLTDGPAGVRIDPTRKGTSQTYYATAFPIGSCLASTWNTELVAKVGEDSCCLYQGCAESGCRCECQALCRQFTGDRPHQCR